MSAAPVRRLSVAAHIALFIAGCAIVMSRRPDALFNAQFYAEDGHVWFQDAHEIGLRALLIPVGGYLNTFSRLIGMLAQLVPLSKAPLVMNVCAIAVQVLPVNVFLSSRFPAVDLRLRMIAGLLYLAVPNSFEIHANTTNIQWHLALLACLLVFAMPVKSGAWRAFEVTTLFLLSVDSPFGIVLLGIAAILAMVRGDAWSKVRCTVLLPGALVQGGYMILSDSRKHPPNGASLMGLVRILGRQVFLPSLVGLNNLRDLMTRSWFGVLEIAAAIIGMAVLMFALLRAPLELKLFVLFAAAVFAASLLRPQASIDGFQWAMLENPGAANRYYFFPMLAFLGALLWIVRAAMPRAIRYGAAALLAVLPFGIWRDWSYPQLTDLNFQRYVTAYDQAAPGTRITIPIYPPPWSMVLTKR